MKKSVFAISALIAASAFAAGDAVDDGKRAEATYCVACHSTRLIDSQRLSTAAWTKEVDKMVGWGAVVPDKQLLINFLASEYSNSKPVPVPARSLNGASGEKTPQSILTGVEWVNTSNNDDRSPLQDRLVFDFKDGKLIAEKSYFVNACALCARGTAR